MLALSDLERAVLTAISNVRSRTASHSKFGVAIREPPVGDINSGD
jgi:hypothetical protein